MAGQKFTIKIDSILGGIAPTAYLGRQDQFDSSLGIDPDQPMTAYSDFGVLMPTSYTAFDGDALNGTPYWLLTSPKGSTESLYVYTSTGKLISYGTALTSAVEQTLAITGGTGGFAGRGGAYYNNYIYMAYGSSDTRNVASDIARFGPLDSSATLQEAWWSSTIAQIALSDTPYPQIESIELPNHAMHVHNDGALYVSDFDSTTTTSSTRGRGLIHKISTKALGTDEGIDNNNSKYNALDLPYGYMPIDIESYGTDLAILAIPQAGADGTNTTFRNAKAALFFWDTVSLAPYRRVDLTDPAASALLYTNGKLYIWSGSYTQGTRLSVYLGGYQVEQLAFVPSGEMPFPGGVDALGNRVFWGSRTTYPANGSCVYAAGYKSLPGFALHNIINTDGGGNAMVTSLGRIRQDSFNNTDLIYGWNDGNTNYGLDKRSSDNANTAVFRTKAYTVGEPFRIKKLTILLGESVTLNQTLTVRFFESKDVNTNDPGTAEKTINATEFPSSERRIELATDFEGINDFILQLKWTGTAQLPVLFPIVIEGETLGQRTI